jgi:hypothetical protein
MEKIKKKTVILCVIHHRQNPSESTYKGNSSTGYNQIDMEKNGNCSKQPRHRTTEDVEQGVEDGLDMQDGRKKPQTAVVKTLLEASQIW